MSRCSNIELCRIVSIVLVMLVHTTFQSIGYGETYQDFGVSLLAAFTIIGVNVFVLITGYFSATPKWLSISNLIFICFFWFLIGLLCKYCCRQDIGYEPFFFITRSNWFIPAYIGLLFMAPVLNAFCDSANQSTLKKVVIALIFIEVWFDLLPPSPTIELGSQGGHSVFSFAILYLLAHYIRLYDVPSWFRKHSLVIYILLSVFIALVSYKCYSLGHDYIPEILYQYSCPFVIISSVAFFITFQKLKVSDSKVINHVAKSTLAVLLGHTAISFLYMPHFKWIYTQHSGIEVIGLWLLSIIIVFTSSIALDQLRLIIYKPIDKWLHEHIKNNLVIQDQKCSNVANLP